MYQETVRKRGGRRNWPTSRQCHLPRDLYEGGELLFIPLQLMEHVKKGNRCEANALCKHFCILLGMCIESGSEKQRQINDCLCKEWNQYIWQNSTEVPATSGSDQALNLSTIIKTFQFSLKHSLWLLKWQWHMECILKEVLFSCFILNPSSSTNTKFIL